jgi:hypothetical protein
MNKFLREVVTTVAVFAVMAAAITGCAKKTADDSEADRSSIKTIPSANVRMSCYDGILYFAVWNNNALDMPYLTGAVIDKETLQPKRCGR